MDRMRFDAMAKSFGAAGSRRVALRTVAGFGVAFGLPWLGLGSTAAKNKHKKKRRRHRKPKPLQRNEFGCVNVGGSCRGKDANCCSGICQGPVPKGGTKDTSHCVAHNELDCPAEADTCQAALGCGTSGFCYQTTGQASFCAGIMNCSDCNSDVDCEPVFGPGAACGVCSNCPNGTFCAGAAP